MPRFEFPTQFDFKQLQLSDPIQRLIDASIDVELRFNADGLSEAIEGFSTNVFGSFSKLFTEPLFSTEELERGIEEASKVARVSIAVCASHGWFPCYYSGPADYNETAALFRAEKQSEAEKDLADLFTSVIDEIEQDVVSRYPHRAAAIQEAIRAHRHGLYYSSTPVFLLNADGICKERIGTQLYGKRDAAKLRAALADLAPRHFYEPLLQALLIPLPLTASAQERLNSRIEFNRHAILHGEDPAYGTEVNSLKALSLLHYISYVLPDDAEEG